MREMLVAVFQTEANADQAANALEGQGISKSMIRRYHRDDVNIPHRATQTVSENDVTARRHETSGGFWSWFLGEQDETTRSSYGSEYDRDYPSYSRAVESGQTVLGVIVEQTESERVMSLLADQMPVELESVGEAAAVGATADTRLGSRHTESTTDRRRDVNRIGGTQKEEVIPLTEEDVEIGKRQVSQGTTRVRRYVVEEPVERQVNLRDEHVEIERRQPTQQRPDGTAFQERTVEVHDTREEPDVRRTARVGEEVVVRKETTERPETVRTTRRTEEVDVDRGRAETDVNRNKRA